MIKPSDLALIRVACFVVIVAGAIALSWGLGKLVESWLSASNKERSQALWWGVTWLALGSAWWWGPLAWPWVRHAWDRHPWLLLIVALILFSLLAVSEDRRKLKEMDKLKKTNEGGGGEQGIPGW